MEKKQNYSEKPKKSPKTLSRSKKPKKDLCPVCDEDLYLDSEFTQRVGLLSGDDDVYGWMCPFCMSEFDLEGDITRIFRDGKISGST